MSPEEIRKELRTLEDDGKKWWHTIDLGHGISTPGRKDIAQDIENWKLDDKELFKDKRVLDIGAWDGGIAFHAEKLGASEVVVIDLAAWDIAAALESDPQGYEGRPDMWWGSIEPFNLAKRALNSKVQSKVLDVYDVSVDSVGRFDMVIFAGGYSITLDTPYWL